MHHGTAPPRLGAFPSLHDAMRATLAAALLLLLAGCAERGDPPAASDPIASSPVTDPAPPAPGASDEAASDTVTVVFFGDSLTAGYGLGRPDRDAYPALLERAWRDDGLTVRVVNAGVSGETSAGGLRRVDWIVQRTPPDVFVLALGANDGLRGTSVDAMRDNLAATLDAVREAAPDARLVLAGMEALPNYGQSYTRSYREVFPDVAEDADAARIPFLLDGVAGNAALNQADGVHPTAEGQRRIAETVGEVVTPIVRELAAARS